MKGFFVRRGVMAACCYILLMAVSSIAGAQIIQGEEIKFDFTKPETLKGRLEYPDHDRLTLSEKGLGLDENENRILFDAGFQTTEPFALGYAWTPTAGVTIHAHLDFDFAYIGVYSLGVLYIRHSPDAEHWSAWQVLEGSARLDKSKLTHDYEGQIVIPQQVRKPYYTLLRTFYKANPKSVGDEGEAVRWIIKNDPHYFEKTTPFVGYIQFLFESNLTGGQHIKSMHNLIFWTLPGLHQSSDRERAYFSAPNSKPHAWDYRAKP